MGKKGMKGSFFILAITVFLIITNTTAALGGKTFVRCHVPKPRIGSVIRRSIPKFPLSSRVTRLNFFFVGSSIQRKDIIRLTLVLEPGDHGDSGLLPQNETFLRDEIYRFLVEQKPEKNTLKCWYRILTNNLLSHLRAKYQDISIRSISVDQFERL